jgi:AcrR family transcriptional regulator
VRLAEIAERAGLTERTFFRHFADKREVLFWGSGALQELLVNGVADAPDSLAPIDSVAAGLDQRDRPARLSTAHPRVARRAASRDRRQMISRARMNAVLDLVAALAQ